ncbi:MAG: DUF6600 domain-containing protein, partial [Rhodoplanes sp.]
ALHRGHWAYTDDWSWYWVSDEPEAQWGWVAYHYGRWIFDDALGWCWVPGDEWSPVACSINGKPRNIIKETSQSLS